MALGSCAVERRLPGRVFDVDTHAWAREEKLNGALLPNLGGRSREAGGREGGERRMEARDVGMRDSRKVALRAAPGRAAPKEAQRLRKRSA